MLPSRPTMQDVAERAGVSLKTVSRVVNREPNVRPEVVSRVRTAIGDLGFRPNEAARLLAKGRSIYTVGLVIENTSNEFYAGLARAVEDAVTVHDAIVVVGSYGERLDRERMIVDAMFGRGVQSIILVPSAGDKSWLADYIEAGLRIVFVDRAPEGLDVADCVLIDNFGGARLGTAHLIQHGHRRIGYVSHSSDVSSVAARTAGYRQALTEAGLAVDESLILRDVFDPLDVERSVARLLSRAEPPTAFFAANNRAAVGVYRATQARADNQAALVGFDDFALADLLGVTVVGYDPIMMGRAAVDRLFAKAGSAEPLTVPVTLVPRGSGERAPRP